MSTDRNEEGLLSRWARRKAEVEKEAALEDAVVDEGVGEDTPQVDLEPDSEEAAMQLLRERDPELAEQIAGIDIEKLAYEDDFSIFMNKKVPEFIRRRALSKLWLLSPVLANVDGLNDYDEDFTEAASVLREFKSSYIPGKGYARDDEDEVPVEEGGDEIAASDEDAKSDEAATKCAEDPDSLIETETETIDEDRLKDTGNLA